MISGMMLGEDLGEHAALKAPAARRGWARIRTTPPGDLNADGLFDAADLLIVLDGLWGDGSGFDALAADLDADGELGIEDVRLALALGIERTEDELVGEDDLPVVLPICGTPDDPCIECVSGCGDGGIGGSNEDVPDDTRKPLPEDGGGGGCFPPDSDQCRDDDGDGIPNPEDCDSQFFIGDPGGASAGMTTGMA